MPLKYKVNVLDALKKAGYTTFRLRKENKLSQSVIQKLRDNNPIGWATIERLCGMLHIQPGDLLEYEPDTTANGLLRSEGEQE